MTTMLPHRGQRSVVFIIHLVVVDDGFKQLWTTQLADYAAERLDSGRRNAQEMTRLGGALKELPALRRACDEVMLSPSHLRLLTHVATPETEGAWLDRARGLCVRTLAGGSNAQRRFRLGRAT